MIFLEIILYLPWLNNKSRKISKPKLNGNFDTYKRKQLIALSRDLDNWRIGDDWWFQITASYDILSLVSYRHVNHRHEHIQHIPYYLSYYKGIYDSSHEWNWGLDTKTDGMRNEMEEPRVKFIKRGDYALEIIIKKIMLNRHQKGVSPQHCVGTNGYYSLLLLRTVTICTIVEKKRASIFAIIPELDWRDSTFIFWTVWSQTNMPYSTHDNCFRSDDLDRKSRVLQYGPKNSENEGEMKVRLSFHIFMLKVFFLLLDLRTMVAGDDKIGR